MRKNDNGDKRGQRRDGNFGNVGEILILIYKSGVTTKCLILVYFMGYAEF